MAGRAGERLFYSWMVNRDAREGLGRVAEYPMRRLESFDVFRRLVSQSGDSLSWRLVLDRRELVADGQHVYVVVRASQSDYKPDGGLLGVAVYKGEGGIVGEDRRLRPRAAMRLLMVGGDLPQLCSFTDTSIHMVETRSGVGVELWIPVRRDGLIHRPWEIYQVGLGETMRVQSGPAMSQELVCLGEESNPVLSTLVAR
jgi:hypothetical protein